jgi:uncharacterized protein YdaU (DUF1376 family)
MTSQNFGAVTWVRWRGVASLLFLVLKKWWETEKRYPTHQKIKATDSLKIRFRATKKEKKKIRSTLLGFAEPSTKLPIWYCHKTTTRYHRTQNNPSIH